jgi:hypothetical protein
LRKERDVQTHLNEPDTELHRTSVDIEEVTHPVKGKKRDAEREANRVEELGDFSTAKRRVHNIGEKCDILEERKGAEINDYTENKYCFSPPVLSGQTARQCVIHHDRSQKEAQILPLSPKIKQQTQQK